MYELIYTYNSKNTKEIKDLILKKFPEAKIDESWDQIHHDRLSVSLPDDKRDEFLIFTIKEGFALITLSIQLLKMESQATRKKLLQLIRKAKES